VLCKTFGKLPSELDREPAHAVNQLLTIMAVEAEVKAARQGGG
jgi:hypothetical protein